MTKSDTLESLGVKNCVCCGKPIKKQGYIILAIDNECYNGNHDIAKAIKKIWERNQHETKRP